MARGWASKSAVIRPDKAEVYRDTSNSPDPVTLEVIRKKESLLLSRTRIVAELKSAQNPRYVELLNLALADLDAKLTTL
jgi:hypothetical protein